VRYEEGVGCSGERGILGTIGMRDREENENRLENVKD
jgi:hypothetical protein